MLCKEVIQIFPSMSSIMSYMFSFISLIRNILSDLQLFMINIPLLVPAHILLYRSFIKDCIKSLSIAFG